ncbi:MAG: LysM peptidoglycan-binding domain-containing protein [Myxococcaceae bacterium]|nr:LysM peptidoglycan-binding domain-containing protein [Myxococcaceae bacterium]
MEHRIRRGDTLWALAKQYNTTVEKLARANNIADPDRIVAGQTLRIPDAFTQDEALDADQLSPPPMWAPPVAFGPRPPPPPPGGPTDISGLGSLSAKYESNGDPGSVSGGRGDPGGVSYGAYQFSTNAGSARAFSAWLQRTDPQLGRYLAGMTPGTTAFSNAWRQLAQAAPDAFHAAQHQFVGERYYEVSRSQLQSRLPGLDLSQRSVALNDVLWSAAVQHGPAGAVTVFTRALAGRDMAQLSDTDIINAVYAERGKRDRNGELAYFSSSSREVQRGVAQRFVSERADALASV